MILQSPLPAHSAIVNLHLELGGAVIELSQSGPDFVVLRCPIDLPPSDATLVVTINGHAIRKPVHLPAGVTRHSSRCELA